MASLLTTVQQRRWQLFTKPVLNISGDNREDLLGKSERKISWTDVKYERNGTGHNGQNVFIFSYGLRRLLRNAQLHISLCLHPVYEASHPTYGTLSNLGLGSYANPAFSVLSPVDAFSGANPLFQITDANLDVYGVYDQGGIVFTGGSYPTNFYEMSRDLIFQRKIDDPNYTNYFTYGTPPKEIVEFLTIQESIEGAEFDAIQIMVHMSSSGANTTTYVSGGWTYTLNFVAEIKASIICEGFSRDADLLNPANYLSMGFEFFSYIPSNLNATQMQAQLFPNYYKRSSVAPAPPQSVWGIVPPISKRGTSLQKVYDEAPRNIPTGFSPWALDEHLHQFIVTPAAT